MQIGWFVTQFFSRLSGHLSVTLLEVSTTAYVICAIIAYVAWWRKPQGCFLPVIVRCDVSEYRQLLPAQQKDYLKMLAEDWDILTDSMPVASPFLWCSGPTFMLFIVGAIHLGTWNIALPSDIEMWMWRSSAILCILCGIVWLLLALPDQYEHRSASGWDHHLAEISFHVIRIVYPIARFYMIIQVFLSLRALPASAYQSVDWSTFVPHI